MMAVDAVLTKPGATGTSGECHFVFSGDQVVEITTWPSASTLMKTSPMAMSSHSIFGGLPAPFNAGIDAVLSKPAAGSGSGELHYVFSYEQVMEITTWSQASTPMKTSPMPIASHPIFSRLPAPFNAKIDAVLSKGGETSGSSERHYVFSGDQVVTVTTWSHAASPLVEPPTAIGGAPLTQWQPVYA